MLHIVNGDATAARLPPLPGDVAVWRDILVEGPARDEPDIAELARVRAPWLARRFGIPAEDYLACGRAEARTLEIAGGHDEIVLWFEQDLFCVANLSFLAAWVASVRPVARVTLVFPEAPLGMSAPDRLRNLYDERHALGDAAIASGAAWWRAYAATNPPPSPATDGNGALPFLDRAWRLHRARFPSTLNGLGAVDAAALDALTETPQAFPNVFGAVTADERMRAFGMADLQLAAHLQALTDGPDPLAHVAGTPPLTPSHSRDWQIALTRTGRRVREGAHDRLASQPLDWWLGGARLEGRRVAWRWDGRALVRS